MIKKKRKQFQHALNFNLQKKKKKRKQFQHARNFNFQIYVLNFASMESKGISTNTSIKYF